MWEATGPSRYAPPRSPIVLRGDGLVLDLPTERDIDRILDGCQHPTAHEYLNSPWPYERSRAEFFVHDYSPRSWADGTAQVFAIRDADGGPVLGTLGVRVAAGRDPDLGYHLMPDARGLGVMTRAVALLLDWTFRHGAQRVTWEAIAGNHASAAIARRLGFTFDGEGPASETCGRHAGRPAWFAHRDRDDSGAEVPGWPAPGELAEAEPLHGR